MKIIGFIFLTTLAFESLGQTRLIHHKSRAGTVQEFRPCKAKGNFGIVSITNEIKPNEKSVYKLIENQEGSLVHLILFKTNKGKLQARKCMAQDKIIESCKANLITKESRKAYQAKREKYIQKLHLLRKKE